MNDTAVVLISLGTISIASTLLFILYKKGKGKLCTCRNRVRNKVVAITGASGGIGYETALQLALYGAKVYLCCRSEEQGENAVSKIRKQTENLQVHFIPLDLCNLKSCNECATLLFLRESKLDILIHNAGIFHGEPTLTTDGFEVHYQTNFLGPIAFTEKILPLLLESPNPKVIFMNSEAHKLPLLDEINSTNFKEVPSLPNFEAHAKHYGLTKLALKVYAGFLANINKDSPFTVTSVNPGNVWTGIFRSCWKHWYEWPKRLLCHMFMKTPTEGAQSIIHAANAKYLLNGSYISDCQEIFPFADANEATFGKKLIEEVFVILNIK